MKSKWHEIWEKRSADEELLSCGDSRKVFLELKRIAGWDATGDMLGYEQFYSQYIQTKFVIRKGALVYDKKVWCLDGDGASLMHMGEMAVIAQAVPDNLVHLVINNGAHESVGGMPIAAGGWICVRLLRVVVIKVFTV